MSESVRSLDMHRQNVSLLRPLLLWENPTRTAIVFAEIMTVLFMAQNSEFLRMILRIIYYSLGVTVALEVVTNFLSGGRGGIVSSFRPSKALLQPINRDQIHYHSNAIASIVDECSYWFKRVFDARDPKLTMMTIGGLWFLHNISYGVSLSQLFTVIVIGAFIIPPIVHRYHHNLNHAYGYFSSAAGQQYNQLTGKVNQNVGPHLDWGRSIYEKFANIFGVGAVGAGAAAAAAAAPPPPAPVERAPSVRAPSVRSMSIGAPSIHSRAPSMRAPSMRAPSMRAPSMRAPSMHGDAMSMRSGMPPQGMGSIRSGMMGSRPQSIYSDYEGSYMSDGMSYMSRNTGRSQLPPHAAH